MGDKRNELIAGSSAAVIALGAYACGNKQDNNESSASLGPVSAECENITLTNVAFENYDNGKFLPRAPKSEFTGNNSAAKYSQDLFDKDGPLAGTADAGSLAVISAAISTPALEKSSTSTDYSYTEQFSNDLSKLTSDNEKVASDFAKELCTEQVGVLGKTAGYEETAIADGEQYTEFRAINGKNSLTGLRLVRKKADRAISGLVYKVQNQQEGQTKLHGFTKVIVEGDGTIDILGYLPTSGKQSADRPGTSNGSKSTKGTGVGQETTGHDGGGIKKGEQGCGDSGKTNCGGGEGTNEGNEGKTPGKTKKPQSTPTPPPQRTPEPTPTPPPQQTPEPTPTPSKTPEPSPTPERTPAKGEEPPADCNNNPNDPRC